MKKRILVISHGHPDFSLGGAEIAAYNLFETYKRREDVEDVWFLARSNRAHGATGKIRRHRPNEYLWEQAVHDWHMMKAAHQESLTTWFSDLIRALKPNIVHMHHYAHMGLEFIRIIKNIDSSIRIFLTLHEYIAICKHNGQMVKTDQKQTLCYRESFEECHSCYPDTTPEDFWLRKHYFISHFDLIDGFISPSRFLKSRYVDWGIKENRIVVIENGQKPVDKLPPRTLDENESRNRFAFFGQITPYKGILTLLQALSSLTKKQLNRIVVEIHGANLDTQDNQYQVELSALLEPLVKNGVVRWAGPYRPGEQFKLMGKVDWVIVPSTWWENSPLVIQEAFSAGRPLLVSDIGGMAEKVIDGIDGVHFNANNPFDLGEKIKWLASDREIWDKLHAGIKSPLSFTECANEHIKYFGVT